MYSKLESLFARFASKNYIWLLSEKSLKIIVSFLVVFLLKRQGEYQIISLFALVELTSFILNTVSIFGTDLVAQREFTNTNKLSKTFNIFFSVRLFSAVIIFLVALTSFSYFVDFDLSWKSKFLLSFFVLLSPFQTVEYFLYGRSNFSLVYKLKFLAILCIGIFKIFLSMYYPEYIIYSVSMDFLLLYLLFVFFLFKEKIVIRLKWYYLYYFFKHYFIKTGYLFTAAILVTMTNHYLFYSAKNNISDYEVSNLYIFLKIAEGLNFLSLNVALMTIPKLKNTSFNFITEFLSIFNKKNYKFSILGIISISLLFSLLFYVYKIDYYVICIVLSLVLFSINSLQIFMGVNFVFQKKEMIKLIMNFGTILFLIMFIFSTTKSSFISYIIGLIFAKFLIIVLMQHKYFKNL